MPKPKLVRPRKRGTVQQNDAARLQHAGKLLHDEIGPLLSGAGLKLQLLSMDFPDAAPTVREVTEVLDKAMDSVRELSRDLHPPPDYSRSTEASQRPRVPLAARRKRK
jgi:hypothetical protein